MKTTAPDPSMNPFGLSIQKLFGFASKVVTGILRASKDFVQKAFQHICSAPSQAIIQNDATLTVVAGSPSATMMEDMSLALSYGSLGFVPVSRPSGTLPSLGSVVKTALGGAARRLKNAFKLKL